MPLEFWVVGFQTPTTQNSIIEKDLINFFGQCHPFIFLVKNVIFKY